MPTPPRLNFFFDIFDNLAYIFAIIKDLDIFFIPDLLATCRDWRTIWSMDSFLNSTTQYSVKICTI